MKHIVKNTKKSKYFIALILFLSLSVLIATSILATVLSNRDGNSASSQSTVPEVLAGEGRQNGMAIAYPSINKKGNIKFIEVENETGKFGFIYSENVKDLVMYYFDEDGVRHDYLPNIYWEDPSLAYSSLFAIESSDGIGQYSLVDYLCVALQTPYFNERIPFETDPVKREKQLLEFGFSDDEAGSVAFTYTTELGETISRIVKIGGKSVTGTGFYFTVTNEDGSERPYIYASLNNYYEYAVSNMIRFLKPLIVSDGLKEDNGYGPYLTTGYYQWLNKTYANKCECDESTCSCEGECTGDLCCSCAGGCRIDTVPGNSTIIAYTDVITAEKPEGEQDLIEINVEEYTKALAELKATPGFKPNYESKNYERVLKALVGKKIGKQDTEACYSFVFADKTLALGKTNSAEYSYTVKSVDAIITDAGDILDTGASAGNSHNLIRVTYDASYGEEVLKDAVAVIDLERLSVSNGIMSQLRSAKIGERLSISFNVKYTKGNSVTEERRLVVTEILDIYDKDGEPADVIAEDSMVGYRYAIYVDGKVAGEHTFWVELKDVTDSEMKNLKDKLIGKKVGKVNIEAGEQKVYYEAFLDFYSYRVSRIDYYVVRELVSAFKFQNSSERDPYYGESLYENLMEDEHRLYGLNSATCEIVARILGGLSDTSASATASGLTGDKVVAVGLSPEVKEKYGLYDHTIYFELPRGIKAYEGVVEKDPDDDTPLAERLDDYTFRSTLGFNIYVSDVDPETNMRYIASDLYDVVTRVPAEDFVFLNYDFESFWARRNIILMEINNIEYFGIEFNMSDLVGKYNFEITHPTSSDKALGVYVTAEGECTENKFTEFISDPKNAQHLYNGGTSLKVLYEHLSDADVSVHQSALPDSLGASCFKDVMRIIYFTTYVDVLPEDAKENAISADKLIMKMSLKVRESADNASPYRYVYEYYRVDDRRILVSIHQESEGGQIMTKRVADFYISTFSFKKIVNNFVSILNAEVIDPDVGYPDEKIK